LLQTPGGAAHFFRNIRGNPVPSPALMAPMTRSFVSAIESFAERQGLDLIRFEKGERKDERTQSYLRQWPGGEGVLYIGKAQEKARVLRTEARSEPASGQRRPFAGVLHGSALPNAYYFYVVDDDFGPFFLKFCSYFPYGAKLCVNGHEYVKRQLTKEGIAYEALDNGILSCADPRRLQALCRQLTAERIDALARKWLARLPHPFTAQDRRAGLRYQISMIQAEFSLTQVFDTPTAGAPVLRGGDSREPGHRAARPCATGVRAAREQTHALALPHARDHRRGRSLAALRLQADQDQAILPSRARAAHRDHDQRLLRLRGRASARATSNICKRSASKPTDAYCASNASATTAAWGRSASNSSTSRPWAVWLLGLDPDRQQKLCQQQPRELRQDPELELD